MMPVVSIHRSSKEWCQRERRGGRVAAGSGDERGGPQLVAVQLWQAVHELVEQLGRGVRLAVPLGVRGRVAQAEVCRQVDDVLHLGPQLGDDRLRCAVGQAAEDEVESAHRIWRVCGELQLRVRRCQAWIGVDHRSADLGVAGGELDRQIRMAGAQAEELGAGEARTADDADADHRAIVSACMIMQVIA